MQAATAMGVRISKSWFLNKFGLVEADPDETALGASASPITPITPIPPINPATTSINSASPAGVLDRLAAAAQDAGMSDAEFMRAAQTTIDSLTEIDPAAASDLAAQLEAAMAAAIVATTKQTLS